MLLSRHKYTYTIDWLLYLVYYKGQRWYVPARSALQASSSDDLVVPRTRRQIGVRSFSVVAQRAWNRLPTLLKLLWSTTSLHFITNWKQSCSSLPADTRKQTDDCFVRCPRSASRGHNINNFCTVTVVFTAIPLQKIRFWFNSAAITLTASDCSPRLNTVLALYRFYYHYY